MVPKYCTVGNPQSTVIGQKGHWLQAEDRHLSTMGRFEAGPWSRSSCSGELVVVSIGVVPLAEVRMVHHQSIGKVLHCSCLP